MGNRLSANQKADLSWMSDRADELLADARDLAAANPGKAGLVQSTLVLAAARQVGRDVAEFYKRTGGRLGIDALNQATQQYFDLLLATVATCGRGCLADDVLAEIRRRDTIADADA